MYKSQILALPLSKAALLISLSLGCSFLSDQAHLSRCNLICCSEQASAVLLLTLGVAILSSSNSTDDPSILTNIYYFINK